MTKGAAARARRARRPDQQRGIWPTPPDLITLDPETSSVPVIVPSANLQALVGRDAELAEKGIYAANRHCEGVTEPS